MKEPERADRLTAHLKGDRMADETKATTSTPPPTPQSDDSQKGHDTYAVGGKTRDDNTGGSKGNQAYPVEGK